jgi:drug/metabolite transporter (DMT)-like permease
MRRDFTPFILFLGILAVSAASIFVRFAQREADSLVIAAGRLGIATLVLAPVALARHRDALRALTHRDLALGLASGALLAVHFASWIASLALTTVLHSVVLVTTTPLWVALLAPLVLGERLSRGVTLGLLLAVAGGAVMAMGGGAMPEGAAAPDAWRGGSLALLGAWAMAGYLLVGRRVRARMALVPYVFVVYGAAAVILALAVALTGRRVAGLDAATWGWIALLAMVPQLIGHTTFNWALRHLPATPVAVVLFGEPVGAALLAFLVLGEAPTTVRLAGSVVILAGVFIAARAGAVEPDDAASAARSRGAGGPSS